jgi:serine/threonine protein kinase
MKTIYIDYSQLTGLDAFFSNINKIDIHDAPFAGGGFGDIYHCTAFNGMQSAIPQVVKIFKDSTDGRNEHSWKTISKLQQCMITEMEKLKANNLDFISEYPALIGLPQFIFEGSLDGKKVKGYVSTNLFSINYTPFDKICEDTDLNDIFFERDIQEKYIMCYHLARAFRLLMKNNFIHADLSADNIFINNQEPLCAIIDFDSGAIVEMLEDNPSTWGKHQDWLAPEVSFQLNKPYDIINVNLFTDAWAVSTAIHYILLSMPTFFLKDLSENSLRYYAQKYKWPSMDTNDSKFNEDAFDYYQLFLELVKELPEKVYKEFECTYTHGVFDPTLRTTYYKWELIFKELIPSDKRKFSWSQISKNGGIIHSGNLQAIPHSPPVTQSTEQLKKYINDLVKDIAFEGEKLERHKFFIEDMAKKSNVDSGKILTEIADFLELYEDVIEDKIITKFEKTSLHNQAKLALIEAKTVDKLISAYEYRE